MTLYKAVVVGAVFCLPCGAEMLRGRILDASRAPIDGARIQSGDVTVDSDGQGQFGIEVPPGPVKVNISKKGFLTQETTVDGNTSPIELVLEVAPQRGSITVSEETGYLATDTAAGTKTLTPLRDVPQSIGVVTKRQMDDQSMMSVADVVRYIPGITAIQGENNRDQLVIRGNSTSADFFLDGVRDDVQYYRDLYNLDRLEALKGPNALVFGRGGGGGVINRVTKQAGFTPLREITIDGGSFGDRRFAADLDERLTGNTAFRVNGVYETSDSFRRFVNLERYGIAPTFTVRFTERTRATLSYERFHDGRTADRGVPSFEGRPIDIACSTYFGNPNRSTVQFTGNIGSAFVEHHAKGFDLTSRILVGDYDRFYQNFVPGAVTADRLLDSLSAYNNATRRRNLFSQTDLVTTGKTGSIHHSLLSGVELGRQATNNFRNTGYFGGSSTSLSVPVGNPVISSPVEFRQSATDANNQLRANVLAGYLQDRIEVNRYLQFLVGLRFDYFDLQYRDNRTVNRLRRIDHLVSPRAGLVFKPISALSLYGSFSVSYLPSSGDQFSSLTTVTQQVKPESFRNYEVGAKFEVSRDFLLTAALFRLNRTNTRSIDPMDSTRIVQTGSQRTNGAEVGWTGGITRKWTVAGGFGYQDAFVSSATASARAGAQVAQAPHATFSLWNRYQLLPRLGAGLGILNRGDMFAAIDNTVVLPGYARADAAVFVTVSERIRLQANVENLFDRKYVTNADNNNNISPGSPRAVRVGVIAHF